MSARAMAWALDSLPATTALQGKALLWLAWRYRDKPLQVSWRGMAAQLGHDAANIRRALGPLQNIQILEIETKGRSKTVITLNLHLQVDVEDNGTVTVRQLEKVPMTTAMTTDKVLMTTDRSPHDYTIKKKKDKKEGAETSREVSPPSFRPEIKPRNYPDYTELDRIERLERHGMGQAIGYDNRREYMELHATARLEIKRLFTQFWQHHRLVEDADIVEALESHSCHWDGRRWAEGDLRQAAE